MSPTGDLSTAEDPNSQSLYTFINGPNKTWVHTDTSSGWYSYIADAGGGDGAYSYDWFQQYCYKTNPDGTAGYCSPMGLIRSGAGLDSIRIFFHPDVGRMDFVVQVYDTQTNRHVGTARRVVKNFMISSPPPSSGFGCDLGEHYFPHPVVIEDVTRWYRRNGCTGAREYSPTGNPNGW